MKIVNLIQRTPEWHAWRLTGIGASEAPIILGNNPWKTPYQLWEEKTETVKVQELKNENIQRGIELEPIAREWYEKKVGHKYPDLLAEHSLFPFMKASLDGYRLFKGIEIKCPTEKTHQKIKETGIPTYYLDQLIHQMYVADLEEIDFISFCNGDGHVINLKRDKQKEERHLYKCAEFWECVVTKKPPPKTEKDYDYQRTVNKYNGTRQILDLPFK